MILGMVDIWTLVQRFKVKGLRYATVSSFLMWQQAMHWQTGAAVTAPLLATLWFPWEDPRWQRAWWLPVLRLTVSQQGRGKRQSGGYAPSFEKLPISFCLCLKSQNLEFSDSTYHPERLENEVFIPGICHTIPHSICQMCPGPSFSPFHCFRSGPTHH